MNSYVAAVVFSVTALVTACSSAAANNASSATDSSNDELRATILAGTFTITGATNETLFNTLTMESDHTFTARGGCRQDGPGAHCSAITSIHGTWKTVKSGPQLGGTVASAPELAFTDSFNQTTTYFYSLSYDRLTLSTTFAGNKSLFDKDLSQLPDLGANDVCADKYGNALGQCPESLPCEYDGSNSEAGDVGFGDVQRCLPPL